MTRTRERVGAVAPALYETTVRHVRQSPLKHRFTYRSYWWFVDLDDLPRLPRGWGALARFPASDHVGGRSTLRAGLDQVLAAEGLCAHRILMLANARTLGHVFNPVSQFWCLDDTDVVVAVVAEVHNTYGDRHCYLLSVDEELRAETDKVFYVSPFHEVADRYQMRAPMPAEQLRIDMTYRRGSEAPFVATVRGTGVPVTGRTVLSAALRHPLATRRVATRIRLQGIRLWLRGLPVTPRTVKESRQP